MLNNSYKSKIEPKIRFILSKPVQDLYTFEGHAKIKHDEIKLCERVNFGISQFLHRGAVLRNSERAIALVIATGKQTK